MAKIIYDNMSLGMLETHIHTRLSGLDYWGDLNLSRHEYETLKQRLRDAVQGKSGATLLGALRLYSNCTVTLAVFLARYDYDSDFWGKFREALNIDCPPSMQTAIGDLICSHLQACGFLRKNQMHSRRKYVDSILSQLSFPPDSSLPDLFDVLQGDNDLMFDPHVLIEELTSWREYLIRKPLLTFLKNFRDGRAVDLLVDIHETMQAVDSGAPAETHLAELYQAWWEQTPAQKHRKKREALPRPHLVYEADGRGLCLSLPSIPLEKEWVEEARWEARSTAGTWRCNIQVFSSGRGRHTASHTLAVRPAEEYQTTLFDAEDLAETSTPLIPEQTISGIAPNRSLLFDTKGAPLSGTSWLPEQGAFLLAGPHAVWEKNDGLNAEQLYAPTLGAYTAYLLTPTAKDAKLICQLPKSASPSTFSFRSHADLLCIGPTLFSIPEADWPIPVFTDFPDVELKKDPDEEYQDLTLQFMGTQYSFSHQLADRFSLKSLLTEQPSFGKYSLRLYQRHHLIRFREFYYLPAIPTDYTPDPSWGELNRQTGRTFQFALPENTALDFLNASPISGEDGVHVFCPPDCAQLDARLHCCSDTLHLDLHLPLLPCRWSLFDANKPDDAVDSLISLHDFVNKSLILRVQLYGNCQEDHYEVTLESANGEEQRVPLRVSPRYTAVLSLAALKDTASHIPMPAYIRLYNISHRELPQTVLVVTETPDFRMRPMVSQKQQVLAFAEGQQLPPMLELTRFGFSDPPIVVDCSAAYPVQKKSGAFLFLPYQRPLPDGIYAISAVSQQSHAFCWGLHTPVSIRSNVFAVPRCTHTAVDSILSPKAYIQQAAFDILRYAGRLANRFGDSTCMQAVPRRAWRCVPLDNSDLAELVALGEFALVDQIPHRMQKQICLLMQRISETFLTAQSRWQLICLLVRLQSSQKVFDLCKTQYGLLLFECSGPREQILEMAQAVQAYSAEISAMVEEQINLPPRDVLRHHLLLLGEEALLSMLGVPENISDEEAQKMRLAFLCEQPGNHVQITLCKELSGDAALLSEMIQITGYHVKLHYQTDRVNSAIFFDQNRYVDLYANWALQMEALADTDDGKAQRDRICRAVKEGQASLVDGLRALRGTSNWVVDPYARALYARQVEGCMSLPSTSISFPRFFYLLGIAALLFCLHPSGLVSDTLVNPAELYLSRASQVAPRIMQRDLVMASTYLYLKRKERSLWQ